MIISNTHLNDMALHILQLGNDSQLGELEGCIRTSIAQKSIKAESVSLSGKPSD